MDREPVITIGAVFTSLKLAAVAIVGVLVIAADVDQELGDALLVASGLVVVAVGDVLSWILTRRRTTPAAEPVVPASGLVRAPDGSPAIAARLDAR